MHPSPGEPERPIPPELRRLARDVRWVATHHRIRLWARAAFDDDRWTDALMVVAAMYGVPTGEWQRIRSSEAPEA